MCNLFSSLVCDFIFVLDTHEWAKNPKFDDAYSKLIIIVTYLIWEISVFSVFFKDINSRCSPVTNT